MKTIEVTDAEDQAVTVYGEEIRHLMGASSKAAGVLAEVWGEGGGQTHKYKT